MKHRSVLRLVLEGFEGAGVTLLALVTWPLSKRWLGNWGSSLSERQRRWPGDDLVSSSVETYTRAIDIAAPPSAVWKWVVQFGLDRAGFYSYELLERVVGIPVKNVEQIIPEFQSLAVGDEIKLHPEAPGIPVGIVKEESHVCFGMRPGEDLVDDAPDPNRSWSIYVESVAPRSSRLLLRGCVEPLRQPSLGKRLGLVFGVPIDFVMEQKMLRTVRRLAESAA